MTKKKSNVQRTVVILLCIMVVFVGAAVSRILRSPEPVKAVLDVKSLQQQGAFIRPQPQSLAEFSLTNEQGETFGNKDLEGQWGLVFLGYTYCPDICPTTLALFKQLQAGWQGADIQYVLLSADPERDTPERLHDYLNFFHEDFVGLTGSVAEVDRLAKQLSSLFARVPQGDGEYLVDHSANVMIINPAGQYHGFIRPPHSVEQLKSVMQAVSAAY